jgi:hypothetical protein
MKSFQKIETEYLDLKALSQYSCLSVQTLRGILSQPGGPSFYRLKGKILVNKGEWDRWLEQFKTAPVNLDALVSEVLADFKGGNI